MPNLWTILLTGLFTGGLTCMAVQGSLLATLMVSQGLGTRDEGLGRKKISIVASFLLAKLIAYTLLGALLGWVGSFFQISFTVQAVITTIISVYMIGVALNMLEVHPIFRYFIFQPPRFLTRLVRNQSKQSDLLAPILLGAFTVVIPCGTTQAMMAQAVTTGSALWGALTLGVFVIGTSPLFFFFGLSVTKLKDVLQTQFSRIAAAALIFMALFNFNNALAISGSPFTFETLSHNVLCTVSFCADSGVVAGAATEEATITIGADGYHADHLALKAGQAVTLHLKNEQGGGCIQAFTIPSLKIQKIVPVGSSADVTFTAPSTPGKLAFMCSMGMYRGEFDVVKG